MISATARRAALLAVLVPWFAAACSGQELVRESRLELRALWRVDLGRTLGRAVAIDADQVAATTLERRCALLDLATGRQRWCVRMGAGLQAGPVLTERDVLGVSDWPENSLTCLERAGGRERWRSPAGGSCGAPVVAGGRVFIASDRGFVRAVALADGKTLWESPLKVSVRSALLAADSLILVATISDSLLALSASSGSVRWGAAPGGALYGPPVVRGGRLWCLSYAGRLSELDLASGRTVRVCTLGGNFRAGLAGPDPLAALSTGGTVYAVDPDSLVPRWVKGFDCAADLPPTVSDERIWIGLRDGSLRALRASDGHELVSLRLTAPVTTPVATVGEYVVVGAGAGRLQAYRWESTAAQMGERALRGAPLAQPLPVCAVGDLSRVSGVFTWIPGVAAAQPIADATVAPRFCGTAVPERGTDRTRFLRWAYTVGWGLGSGLALWLQAEGDDAYGIYQRSGDPERRERAFQQAERYDRGVVISWVGAELLFLLAVRAWLNHAAGDQG